MIVHDNFWNRIKSRKFRKVAQPTIKKENVPGDKKPRERQRKEGSL
jgi:hypothetical protein